MCKMWTYKMRSPQSVPTRLMFIALKQNIFIRYLFSLAYFRRVAASIIFFRVSQCQAVSSLLNTPKINVILSSLSRSRLVGRTSVGVSAPLLIMRIGFLPFIRDCHNAGLFGTPNVWRSVDKVFGYLFVILRIPKSSSSSEYSS